MIASDLGERGDLRMLHRRDRVSGPERVSGDASGRAEGTEASPGRLRIGGAEADLARGAVRAPDGTTTELRRQSAEVLRRLAARPGETVSKEALHAEVWGGIAVTDDSLVQCIGDIRRALGSAREALRTVPREGYRLEVGEPAAPRRRWTMAAAAAVVLATALAWGLGAFAPAQGPARGPVVAVLPFANAAGGERWDRLARGVTEEIVADLARNDWVFVYAAAASAPHAGATPQAVRAALAADYVVTGSVQADGGRVQIAAMLADAETGRQVWAESRVGPENDLLTLQTEAADALTAELSGSYSGALVRAGRTRALAKTDSLAAYDLYLLGIEQKHRFTRESLGHSKDDLQRAVALDPSFAKAWVGLSITQGLLGMFATSEEEYAQIEAEQLGYIERAMAADPTDPQVLLESSRLKAVRGDLAAAERAIRQAVERAPNDADVLAIAAWAAPERSPITTEAVAWAERALALNPTRPDWYMMALGQSSFAAGDYAGAIAALRGGPKDLLDGWLVFASAAGMLGDNAAAQEASAEIHRIMPDFDLDFYLDGWPWEPTFRDMLYAGAVKAGLGGSVAAAP